MIPVSQAINIIKENTRQLESETVDLDFVCNRVLAENIFADMDVPPFDRSQMDGYAVKASDTKNAPVRLKIVGEAAAGKSWEGVLKPGQAVRIMTGAAVPAGASAVQKLEVTKEDDESIEIFEAAHKGQNIVLRRAEIEKGQQVFSAGEIISPGMVASLAAFGCSEIAVGRRPKVMVFSTGREIVDVSDAPQPDQIRNSNTPMLRAYAEHAGATVESLPIATDELAQLKTRVELAAQNCDALILTGGVSVGKYDLTKLALTELGAHIYFDKIAVRPGKPMVFARLGQTLIFGLPGNPVSAAVTFQLFVRPALLQMQGALQTELKQGFAILAEMLKGSKGRDSYLPVTLFTNEKGHLIAQPIKWGGSSDFVSFARAGALAIVSQNKNIAAQNVASIVFL